MTYPTADEVIATLARSNFPAVIIEGKDDVVVYRRLEDQFAEAGVTIIPVGGRSTVLSIFERRAALPADKKVVFIADLDTWIITGVPEKYNDVSMVLTRGYSIENDMFVDGNLIGLMSNDQRTAFEAELSVVINWYCIALKRKLSGAPDKIDHHPNVICDNHTARAKFTALNLGEEFPSELRDEIAASVWDLLRGKTLMDLLIRQLRGYNNRILLNIGAANSGERLVRIIERVSSVVRPVPG